MEKEIEKKEKEELRKVPWIDTLAAIIAVYETLLVPFALLIIALIIFLILFRIFLV